MKLKHLILLIISLLLIIGGVLAYNFYLKIYQPNTVKQGELYIPTNANFEEVSELVRPFLKRVKPFVWVAKKKNYPGTIKPGKYQISEGMNNNELVNLLRSGNQKPIMLSFNNQDSLEKLAGRIAVQIEADSTSLLQAFKDEVYQNEIGFNKATALCMYLPNTYQFYWNTSAEEFRNKMFKEFNRFWTDERLQQAAERKLSKTEVITLASIVQKETALIEERPDVAKLYLNRLMDGWPLQADPTIIYILNKISNNSVKIRRVLNKDLKIQSPYNTYLNAGLPPGPIGMPDISSIEAVLHPANHNYYYMCASVTEVGKHEFATTLSQHNRNARKYQNWLNDQNIRR